ncbi:MAG: preprotein translocase subunit SecG [Clostridiales bacterium]|nr:preprotein translocase subunit SecG [Clostridiales bacterium]
MNPIEIVGGVLLLISSVLIILIVMMQSGRESNMSASLTGTQADSYLGRNQSRTKEARLARLTKVLAVVFFVVTLAVNLITVLVK